MPRVPNRRAFFIHIPRTGGTSVERGVGIAKQYAHLMQAAGQTAEKNRVCYGNIQAQSGARIELDHATAPMLRERVPDLGALYVFAVARNPYDRLVSQFCYARQHGPRLHKRLDPTASFDCYVRTLYKNWDDIVTHPDHWRASHVLPQCAFVDGIDNVHVFRTETLCRDWQHICFELELPHTKLPRARASRNKPRMTAELAKLVYEMYRGDFERFGYDERSWQQPAARAVLVDNSKHHFHYETIESAIDMLPALAWPAKVDAQTKITVLVSSQLKPSTEEWKYLAALHPGLAIHNRPTNAAYDLHVFVTAYPATVDKLDPRAPSCRYIMHNFDGQARDKRFFYLAPHVAKVSPQQWYLPLSLPFASGERPASLSPVVVIQGSLVRRDWSLLAAMLHGLRELRAAQPFIIRIVGKGEQLPKCLEPYKDWIDLRLNLDFKQYHQSFADAHAIMTCTSKADNMAGYYTSKLSSSLSYGLAYNLPIICDQELSRAYRLPKAYVGKHGLRDAVQDFYKQRRLTADRSGTPPAAPHSLRKLRLGGRIGRSRCTPAPGPCTPRTPAPPAPPRPALTAPARGGTSRAARARGIAPASRRARRRRARPRIRRTEH